MQAIWPDAENVENHWFSFVFGHAAALGGVLEASWSVLERSWSCLGAVATADAAFDVTEAASKLLRAASKRSCIDRKLLRSALVSISSSVVPVSSVSSVVSVSFLRRWLRKTRCRKRIFNIQTIGLV